MIDEKQKNLPTFHGGKDRALARQMIDDLGGTDGFRTRITSTPDGTVTRVKTKNGRPEVITTRRPPATHVRRGWTFEYAAVKSDDAEGFVQDTVSILATPRWSGYNGTKVRRFNLKKTVNGYVVALEDSKYQLDEGVFGLDYWYTDRDWVTWTRFVDEGSTRYTGGAVQWGDLVIQAHPQAWATDSPESIIGACVAYDANQAPFLRIAVYFNDMLGGKVFITEYHNGVLTGWTEYTQTTELVNGHTCRLSGEGAWNPAGTQLTTGWAYIGEGPTYRAGVMLLTLSPPQLGSHPTISAQTALYPYIKSQNPSVQSTYFYDDLAENQGTATNVDIQSSSFYDGSWHANSTGHPGYVSSQNANRNVRDTFTTIEEDVTLLRSGFSKDGKLCFIVHVDERISNTYSTDTVSAVLYLTHTIGNFEIMKADGTVGYRTDYIASYTGASATYERKSNGGTAVTTQKIYGYCDGAVILYHAGPSSASTGRSEVVATANSTVSTTFVPVVTGDNLWQIEQTDSGVGPINETTGSDVSESGQGGSTSLVSADFYDMAFCVQFSGLSLGNDEIGAGALYVYRDYGLAGSVVTCSHPEYCADWCKAWKEMLMMDNQNNTDGFFGYIFKNGTFHSVTRHPGEPIPESTVRPVWKISHY